MSWKIITPTSVNFNPITMNCLLDIDENGINFSAVPNKWDWISLRKKDEFHKTVIWSDTGKRILSIIKDEAKNDIKKKHLQEIALSKDWEIEAREEYFLIEKWYTNKDSWELEEVRTTIIQSVVVEDMQRYYEAINTILWTRFEVPPAHITLYSTSTHRENTTRWIGLYSEADMRKYLKKYL